MHELSVARALVDLVADHVPYGMRLRRASVQVGPMQAIVPEAMEGAWHAATRATVFANAKLVINILPWTLTCRACGRAWTSREPYQPCTCGSERATLQGSDEITLMTIDVAEHRVSEPEPIRVYPRTNGCAASREWVR
jgi:hydrogenase nickel incorporation protein HypA/HybF